MGRGWREERGGEGKRGLGEWEGVGEIGEGRGGGGWGGGERKGVDRRLRRGKGRG